MLTDAGQKDMVAQQKEGTQEKSDAGPDLSQDDEEDETSQTTTEIVNDSITQVIQDEIDVQKIPAYDGEPYVQLNDNQPDFDVQEITTEEFESYSTLDALGRCGVAFANISEETMPTDERGKIGMIKPSGWHTIKYDFVDGRYLYNRCHLIGYQLAGENANEKNLITGTRYLNTIGMLPFENQIANYVERTANHVLYRVTPIYAGDNLVADGVQMEGYSVEDEGAGICFNVYVYNCQPGVVIDYRTGDSQEADDVQKELTIAGLDDSGTSANENQSESNTQTDVDDSANSATCDYVINTNTGKFHSPTCSSTKTMKEKNTLRFTGSRDEVIAKGYVPCKNCNP